MQVTKRGDDFYEVSSESSSRNYVVTWGSEGDFWSCNCTAYAIGRNKAGGMGVKFECKHIRELDRQLGGAAPSAPAQKESVAGVKEKLLLMAADLEGKEAKQATEDEERKVLDALEAMAAELGSKEG
jgi:hypothetical protein